MDAFDKYIGRVFDKRYKIEKVIGVGGMAIVFKAEDILMNRTVAIKMLKNDVAGDVEALRRFINESKAVAMLSHENIVNIYDVSVKGNTKYIVMEYIEGITLKAFLKHKGGSLSWRETLNISEQILRALEHAHSKGVIHRDIKPQNIMLLKNGLIKVADFGIAKLPDADAFTVTDQAIGTVNYISPEQAMNKESIDERSDLYSVGVLMYELSCGELPFTGDTPVAVAYKHVNDTPKSPRLIKPDMPQGLEQIIMRAMEKSPDMRYQSARQMLAHISALKKNPGIKFRTVEELEAIKAGKKTKKTKEKKPKNKKTVRERGGLVLPIILGVFFALLIIVVILVIVFFQITQKESEKVDIKVENYVGRIYDEELCKELEKLGCKIRLVNDFGGSAVNEIVKQYPQADGDMMRLTSDFELVLYLSDGKSTGILPDFTCAKLKEIKSLYNDYIYDFTDGDTNVKYPEYVESKEYPAGIIISTDPPAGTEVEKGQKIKLVVSNGYNETKPIPNVTKIDVNEAIKILKENGMIIGDIDFEYSDPVPEKFVELNKVISQVPSPAEKQQAAIGTVVNLVVSLGPPVTETEEYETDEDGEIIIPDE